MSNCNRYFGRLSLLVAMVALTGCVGRPLIIEAPPWYQQDSGAHYAANGRVFYGIGKAGGTRNMTLLRATAANRARQEMARVLDNYVSELFQSAGAMPALTMEEGEQVIGALVRDAIGHAVISDQWGDAGQGQLYALCQLDLDTFKQVLASQTVIDVEVRTAMMAEAENVHTLLAGKSLNPNATIPNR